MLQSASSHVSILWSKNKASWASKPNSILFYWLKKHLTGGLLLGTNLKRSPATLHTAASISTLKLWWKWSNSSSVQFSRSVVSYSLWPQGLQHPRPPWPSPTLGIYPNSCPSSQWCHPTVSASVVPFSFCLQSFPASGSFPMSQFFESCGQSIVVSASASVLPMNLQDWFPLVCTGWISLQSKGFSRVFSNTTIQKHQFFSAQLSF